MVNQKTEARTPLCFFDDRRLQLTASLSVMGLTLFLFCVVSTVALFGDVEVVYPIHFHDQWQFEDPAAWQWEGEGEASLLVLKKQSLYKPKFRRPLNLAWFGGKVGESFTLTCEARLDVFNAGNNDLCLAFDGLSDSEFYYAHLGETADGVHLQFHIVNLADRKAITTFRTNALAWQPDHWHPIKLERNASTGSMKVWFEDQLVLEATNKTFSQGKIGLGSFDDRGAFRKVAIKSLSLEKSEVLEVVAGGGSAVGNDLATKCRVTQPFGIAFDPQDNMYICEETHRLLRVDALTSVLKVVTTAKEKESPIVDRVSVQETSFNAPHNLVADGEGNLYIADTYHYAVRRVDARTGVITTLAGTGSKKLSGDEGPAANASLDGIGCLCFNHDFTKLYLGGFSKVIRVVDMETKIISTVRGITGSRAMAVDSKANLFTAVSQGVRMLGTDGRAVSLTDAAASPPLNAVKHLWADRDDNILIADAGNHLIRKFIVSENKIVTLVGDGTKVASRIPGPALLAQLNEPHGVVTHPRTGDIYIADSRNNRVLRLKINP